MINTEHLGKTFAGRKKSPPVVAVKDLNIEVAEGEVFGFLGPNGAGKTTTVRMLTSLIGPTGGEGLGQRLRRSGKTTRRSGAAVGILTETPGMYDRLSAERT